MPKLVYGIHAIHHVPPGQTKARTEQPGTLFEVADADYAFYKARDAVRDPTEREIAFHKLSTGEAQLVEAPASKSDAASPGVPASTAPAAPSSTASAADAGSKKAATKASSDADDSIG